MGGHDLAVRGVSKYKVDMIFIIFREFNTMFEILVDSYPRNITSATCLRRLPYIWRHLRQRNFVDKTEAYHIRQHASRFLTTFWHHIF